MRCWLRPASPPPGRCWCWWRCRGHRGPPAGTAADADAGTSRGRGPARRPGPARPTGPWVTASPRSSVPAAARAIRGAGCRRRPVDPVPLSKPPDPTARSTPPPAIFTADATGARGWRYGAVRTVAGEEVSGASPNQPAPRTMHFIDRAIASLNEQMGEGRRWSGRTQSRASWSPEQLRHQLRLPVGGTPDPTARTEVRPGPAGGDLPGTAPGRERDLVATPRRGLPNGVARVLHPSMGPPV